MPEQAPAGLGRPGEPCEECGAPLAEDQRYCLECGHRRGGPRVDYRSLAGDSAAPSSPSPPPAQPVEGEDAAEKPERRERDYAPLAAVGGIAVLGLMLLVGVLIGKGSSTATAPATPQVVKVGAAEEGGGGGEGSPESGGTGKQGGAGASGKKKNTGGGGGGDKEVVEASSDQLEELESETGEDAAKKALELPNKIATPGAPPPIDKSEPPGGGEGGGVTIK